MKSKMKVYVPVCDKYIHLMPIYAWFFNKYWGPYQEVICLVSHTPRYMELPLNFKFVDIGEKWAKEPWTNALIDYFQSVDDEYFVLTLEDHFLVRPIDTVGLAVMEQAIIQGEADKAMIHAHLNHKYGEPYGFMGEECVKLIPDAPYKTSIHPAIWTRELFLRWAKPNQQVWAFELNQQESKSDGSVVISWPAKTQDGKCLEQRGDNIFNIHNVYRGGVYQEHELNEGVVDSVDIPLLGSLRGMPK